MVGTARRPLRAERLTSGAAPLPTLRRLGALLPKFRFASLEERGDALAKILRACRGEKAVALGLELDIERARRGLMHKPFHRREGERRTLGDALRYHSDFVIEHVRRHHAVDEPERDR